MLNSMPPEWSRRVRALPEFTDTRQWDCLRHCRHSEVWRVTLASGAMLIAKRGVGAEVREAQVYHDLLVPLALPHPTVFAALPEADAQILLMEDLGLETRVSRPTADRFAEAARTLADLRRHAGSRLLSNGLPAAVHATYALSADANRVSVQRVMDRAVLAPRKMRSCGSGSIPQFGWPRSAWRSTTGTSHCEMTSTRMTTLCTYWRAKGYSPIVGPKPIRN